MLYLLKNLQFSMNTVGPYGPFGGERFNVGGGAILVKPLINSLERQIGWAHWPTIWFLKLMLSVFIQVSVELLLPE